MLKLPNLESTKPEINFVFTMVSPREEYKNVGPYFSQDLRGKVEEEEAFNVFGGTIKENECRRCCWEEELVTEQSLCDLSDDVVTVLAPE